MQNTEAVTDEGKVSRGIANRKVTINEIKSLQDLRRYVTTRLHNQSHFNAVDRAHFFEMMPNINSLLSKLEDSI